MTHFSVAEVGDLTRHVFALQTPGKRAAVPWGHEWRGGFATSATPYIKRFVDRALQVVRGRPQYSRLLGLSNSIPSSERPRSVLRFWFYAPNRCHVRYDGPYRREAQTSTVGESLMKFTLQRLDQYILSRFSRLTTAVVGSRNLWQFGSCSGERQAPGGSGMVTLRCLRSLRCPHTKCHAS
jgi:hypothetical protein